VFRRRSSWIGNSGCRLGPGNGAGESANLAEAADKSGKLGGAGAKISAASQTVSALRGADALVDIRRVRLSTWLKTEYVEYSRCALSARTGEPRRGAHQAADHREPASPVSAPIATSRPTMAADLDHG